MGQFPCACDSHCEPLVHLADPSGTTVKVDPGLLQAFDDACFEHPGDIEKSIIMPQMQRCPARDTFEDQTARRIAMLEAANEAAEAACTAEAERRIFEERILKEIQLQRADEHRRQERKQELKQQEVEDKRESNEAASDIYDVVNFENDRLPVWLESASQEAEEEAEMEAERAASLEAIRVSTMKENASLFLASEGFDSVTSCRKLKTGIMYPLHVAVERNDAEAVRCLLAAKADPTQSVVSGCLVGRRQTPRQLALRRNQNGSHTQVLAALDD
mmetsp:Transcript_15692/g.25504  ORF Transcript_15692/g.25504 Transcript_15692/m.25504 type:complete len:274 (+) Transcript_15692:107-928(+)